MNVFYVQQDYYDDSGDSHFVREFFSTQSAATKAAKKWARAQPHRCVAVDKAVARGKDSIIELLNAAMGRFSSHVYTVNVWRHRAVNSD